MNKDVEFLHEAVKAFEFTNVINIIDMYDENTIDAFRNACKQHYPNMIVDMATFFIKCFECEPGNVVAMNMILRLCDLKDMKMNVENCPSANAKNNALKFLNYLILWHEREQALENHLINQ
jgi:hypothetical protein